MSDKAVLQQKIDAQIAPVCAALTPHTVENADLETGEIVLRFAPQKAFENHFGNIQGGFAAAMVDVLISTAVFASTEKWLPTVEIKSTFLAPLKLDYAIGEASIIKAGRRLIFLEARIWGSDKKLAVHATATVANSP